DNPSARRLLERDLFPDGEPAARSPSSRTAVGRLAMVRGSGSCPSRARQPPTSRLAQSGSARGSSTSVWPASPTSRRPQPPPAAALRRARRPPRVAAAAPGALEFIASNGPRLLLEAREAAETARVAFAVVKSRSPGVRRGLTLLGLDQLLNLVGGLDDIER